MCAMPRGEDKRGVLQGDLFRHTVTKDSRVFLYWNDRHVKTLSPNQSAAFLAKMNGATPYEQQLIMAKITGNFKRGNERIKP